MAGEESERRPAGPAEPAGEDRPPGGQDAGTPENPVVPGPSLPPETYGQGSPLDRLGSVPPGEAESSAGSID